MKVELLTGVKATGIVDTDKNTFYNEVKIIPAPLCSPHPEVGDIESETTMGFLHSIERVALSIGRNDSF